MSAPYVDPPEDPDKPRQRRKLSVLWRLAQLMTPYRGRFAFAVVMLLAASGITLVYPQAGRFAVDQAMASGSRARLDLLALAVIVLALVNAVFVWLRHYTISWLGQRVVTD